jgi:DNA-binding transcriptional LysR family regulator
MLEERSVTRAGARLGLTQSAVSHALNRLRYVLNDELFTAGSHGHAADAARRRDGPAGACGAEPAAGRALAADFDPATSERRFSVVAGPYASAILVRRWSAGWPWPRRMWTCASPNSRPTS